MLTPSRLLIARKRRGLTAVELARRTDLTAQSISNYERGRQSPNASTLARIAMELDFPLTFFSQSDIDELPLQQISFRARSKIPAIPRDAARSAARLALELNEWIESRFRLPQSDVPTLTLHTPEQAAEFVRARWGIHEESAAPNMVHLLELKGVRVYSLAPDYGEVDAFSMWHQGIPFVFLNTLKTGERGRFDAAHELGHLVLHAHNGCNEWSKDVEKEANAFASAFLMSRVSMADKFRQHPTTDQIIRAKKHWGVAALALTYRLNELGFLSEWSYRRNIIELGKMGYRSGEPGGIPRETSQVLEKVIRSLREKGVTPGEIAKELHTTQNELSSWVFGLVMTSVGGQGQKTSVRSDKPALRLVGSV